MVLDFNKLGGGSEAELIVEPRKIFSTLPAKASKFKFLHDVQSEVLAEWFERRNETDLVIKMNTGSGKTLVGLLLLQSSLVEGEGPAVFVTPDNFLVQQVIDEAGSLGIAATHDAADVEFLQGRAILVINVHKLFNGRSVFGVWDQGSRISIGTIVIDDAHACLTAIRDQFTLEVVRDNAAYLQLLTVFDAELHRQSPTIHLDIRNGDPQAFLDVPFWVWQRDHRQIVEILHPAASSDDEFTFKWPFIRYILENCRCVVGGNKIEIAPRCIPINSVPSFEGAQRKIYTTATLADDSALITVLAASPDAVAKPITPSSAGDIGDRMIIVPQSLNPSVVDDEIKEFAATVSKEKNVVVIVPSIIRSQYWADVASQTLTSQDIWEGVAKLKHSHVGLTVLVNRFDGIDLPDDACRLLIIDSLPEHQGLIEASDFVALDGTYSEIARQVQRIEQGMGRGIRSNDDSCVVFLMGKRLVHRLNDPRARQIFTPGTRAQLELAEKVAEQIKGKPISDLSAVTDLCFDRNPDWVSASKKAVVEAAYEKLIEPDRVALAIRGTFDQLQVQQSARALEIMQDAVNECGDRRTKGWLMVALAEVTNPTSPENAQEILLSALSFNSRLIKPIAGIAYSKLSPPAIEQAASSVERLRGKFIEGNAFLIALNALIDDLKFQLNTAKPFEAAIKSLGYLLGFASQRPEVEFGSGPDNLWAALGQIYYVIECKNGAVSEHVAKSDANQLSGSINWFYERYDEKMTATPIMIHPSRVFMKGSTPPPGARIIDQACLATLRDALTKFGAAAATENAFLDVGKMGKLLDSFALTPEKFLSAYSVDAISQ